MWGRLDPEAVEYVEGASVRLLPFAKALTRCTADAEDLLQDSLATVLVKWRQVAAADQPDAYVRRLMVNGLVSRKRRRSSHEIPTDGVSLDGVVPFRSPLEDRDELQHLLAPLSERQRAALVLRYLEDMSDEQVGEILGCTAGSVRSLVSRALQSLHRARPEAARYGAPAPVAAQLLG